MNAAPTKTIDAKSASLQTATVAIQTLNVNGKQMTLAVFRQLQWGLCGEEGEAWGVVHYAIKPHADLWLVFSHDGVLMLEPLHTTLDDCYIRWERHALDRVRFAHSRLESHNARPPLNADSERRQIVAQIARAEAEYADSVTSREGAIARTERAKRLVSTLPQLFIAV